MKAAKLREQTDEELRSLARDLAKELQDLKVKGLNQGDSPVQPMRKRAIRRDLARIETILKERGAQNHG